MGEEGEYCSQEGKTGIREGLGGTTGGGDRDRSRWKKAAKEHRPKNGQSRGARAQRPHTERLSSNKMCMIFTSPDVRKRVLAITEKKYLCCLEKVFDNTEVDCSS